MLRFIGSWQFVVTAMFFRGVRFKLSHLLNIIKILAIRISQMFPRPGVQRDYPEGENDIL